MGCKHTARQIGATVWAGSSRQGLVALDEGGGRVSGTHRQIGRSTQAVIEDGWVARMD